MMYVWTSPSSHINDTTLYYPPVRGTLEMRLCQHYILAAWVLESQFPHYYDTMIKNPKSSHKSLKKHN